VLREGSLAPDFTLPTADGQLVSLGEALRSGRNVLLVFLRHLGCLLCREHVAQLSQYRVEQLLTVLKRLNGRE
jgi:peroxiredoxin